MTDLAGTVGFLIRLAVRTDRGRLLKAGALLLIGYVATPVIAVLLKYFTDGALGGDGGLVATTACAIVALLVAEVLMSHFAHLYYFELSEMMEVTLNADLIDLANGPRRIDSLDAPGFADTLALIRQELTETSQAMTAVLQVIGVAVQTALTAVWLTALNPWLALLIVAALPPVLLARVAQRRIDAAQDATAELTRRSQHLLHLGTTAAAVKEIRLFGAGPALVSRQQQAWDAVTAVTVRAQTRAAALRALGQLAFALAYGGAMVVIVRQYLAGRATVGDAILLITLAVQVSVQVSGLLSHLATLQRANRVTALMRRARHAAAVPSPALGSTAAIGPVTGGITLDRVGFTYPNTDRPVLGEVSLHLPAGSSVAIVGENGAGKSTLIKLLCGLYAPTSGRLLVDGVDLATVPSAAWQSRVAVLFQDFARLQLRLAQNVGVGDLDRLDDAAAVHDAIRRARAERIVDLVPGGLEGTIGQAGGSGTELSGGQWQSLGLARAMMRESPALLVLDEPAAALDATAEHALFERYASSSRQAAAGGGVTVFVSHRFSTVSMADLIVVLDGGRIVESGSHEQLTARGGLYAELYDVQARAYR